MLVGSGIRTHVFGRETTDRAVAYRMRNAAVPWGAQRPSSGLASPKRLSEGTVRHVRSFPVLALSSKMFCAESTVCKERLPYRVRESNPQQPRSERGVSSISTNPACDDPGIPAAPSLKPQPLRGSPRVSSKSSEPGLAGPGSLRRMWVHIIASDTGPVVYQTVSARYSVAVQKP